MAPPFGVPKRRDGWGSWPTALAVLRFMPPTVAVEAACLPAALRANVVVGEDQNHNGLATEQMYGAVWQSSILL